MESFENVSNHANSGGTNFWSHPDADVSIPEKWMPGLDTDHVFVELDVRETSIDKIEWRSVFTVTGYILDPRQKWFLRAKYRFIRMMHGEWYSRKWLRTKLTSASSRCSIETLRCYIIIHRLYWIPRAMGKMIMHGVY